MNIKKGDTVLVRTGKDAGKKGKVVATFAKENKVLVEGVNMKKKHVRPRSKEQKGQTIEIAHPINRSNVSLLDPKSGKPTRIGSKEVNGKKVRIATKSGQEV